MQVIASDNNRYWLKPLNNGQSPRVPINEQIVSRCAKLIDAHVAGTALVRIPDELAGASSQLEPGIAHGSLDIASAQVVKGLKNLDRDDNAKRQAFFFVLYDWCFGSDYQFLEDSAADCAAYSHDHGHYFPNGPNWTVDDLRANTAESHLLSSSVGGLSREALAAGADNLERVERDQIVEILQTLPTSWPVTGAELETMGFFLESRRDIAVAEIRTLIGGN